MHNAARIRRTVICGARSAKLKCESDRKNGVLLETVVFVMTATVIGSAKSSSPAYYMEKKQKQASNISLHPRN